MSSCSVSLRTPPARISETSIPNSSSVNLGSFFPSLKRQKINFFHKPNRKLSGRKRLTRKRSGYAETQANVSGRRLASTLGVISPKMSTTIVSTTVETVGPICSPISEVKISVPILAEAILTMLSAISSVESTLL